MPSPSASQGGLHGSHSFQRRYKKQPWQIYLSGPFMSAASIPSTYLGEGHSGDLGITKCQRNPYFCLAFSWASLETDTLWVSALLGKLGPLSPLHSKAIVSSGCCGHQAAVHKHISVRASAEHRHCLCSMHCCVLPGWAGAGQVHGCTLLPSSHLKETVGMLLEKNLAWSWRAASKIE